MTQNRFGIQWIADELAWTEAPTSSMPGTSKNSSWWRMSISGEFELFTNHMQKYAKYLNYACWMINLNIAHLKLYITMNPFREKMGQNIICNRLMSERYQHHNFCGFFFTMRLAMSWPWLSPFFGVSSGKMFKLLKWSIENFQSPQPTVDFEATLDLQNRQLKSHEGWEWRIRIQLRPAALHRSHHFLKGCTHGLHGTVTKIYSTKNPSSELSVCKAISSKSKISESSWMHYCYRTKYLQCNLKENEPLKEGTRYRL